MRSGRPLKRLFDWGCLASVVAILLAIVIAYRFVAGYFPTRTFDAAAWRQVKRADDETRLQMVDSLIQSGKLDRMTQSEVLALLGPDCACDYFADWDLAYWLGPERGSIRIDSEWLVIRFGRDGRVSEYQLARD